ncbi:hypothetical protein [Streptomyces sp. NPDC046197]|uniref:hypothetical protein n=1 Tax=Streptomyces sp. NPDC046197 TaxID=3154337 RepID=UPI003402D34D
MRVIRVVSAALLGVTALTFSAPAAVASGGDSHSYGGGSNSRSYGGGGDSHSGGGGGKSYSDSDDGGDEDRSGGRGGEDRSGGRGGEDRSGGRGEEDRSGGRGGEDRSGGDDGGKPEHFQHGVRAGEGGTIAGFDLKEIGMGTALIAGSVGAAYYLSRRRTGEEAA